MKYLPLSKLIIPAVFTLQFVTCIALSQPKSAAPDVIKRPKLVVGIVVDQMRWDYLYRFYDRYSEGGFKRLLKDGFRCENTYINYLPSATAVGHSAIFSGTTPAINGMAGNDWVDQLTGAARYCVSDSTVNSVGSNSDEGKMSPRNLLSTTVTDELRLATNFRSKVVGISLKDRAAILPAGHTPTGAFWFDDASGHFITSTYYMGALPGWVTSFNNRNEPEKLLAKGWDTMYPIATYIQSDPDNSTWEGKFAGEANTAFPHHVDAAYQTRHTVIRSTPFGNTLTLDFARAAIDGYNLGTSGNTDFLTINCASTDYVGHMFGVNAIETEDTYLRLDRDLAAFFKNLDDKVGKGNYLVFLTADHGASSAIAYNKAHNIPAGQWSNPEYKNKLNAMLKTKFGTDNLVLSIIEYQINFNLLKVQKEKLDYAAIKKATVDMFRQDPTTLFVADMAHINDEPIPAIVKEKMINGYNYRRSGSVFVIPTSGYLSAGLTGTSHGEWNNYDTHVPLVFMGWGIKAGASYSNIYTTDIAPTVSSLLHIQAPSGAIGSPIPAVLNGIENGAPKAIEKTGRR